MSLLRWMCVLALASALGACGDDGSGEPTQEVPEPVSADVSAEDGANIATEGAAIDIPGGALAEDTEVTVDVILPNGQPDEERLASLIYDFGPDGTTFETPVELTITLNDDVPEGMEAQMAWLDEDTDKWVPLADSHLDGNEVIATTTHFTMFAIVLSATEGQTAGGCEDFADFEPCGGDVTGTWEFTLACADLTLASIFGDSEIATCDGVVLSATADISGTATFEDGGAYSSEIERDFSLEVDIPLECIPMGAPCSALGGDGDDPDAPVVTEADGVCTLSADPPAESESEMGTYELDGDTLIMTADGEAEADAPSEYCIEGNTITVRMVDIDEEDGHETVTFFQATRR